MLFVVSGMAADTIDLERLLGEMADRSRIAEFPQPEFVCKQASSYNRKSETPANPDWFAGGDFDQFYGSQSVEVRKEWIMLDAEGPGAIVRWWQTQYKCAGKIRIYLDHEREPIFQGTGDQLLGSGVIASPPFSANHGGGLNLHLPIPFDKHCRITFESSKSDADFTNQTPGFKDESLFYNINYLQYARGTEVKTLTRPGLEASRKLIARIFVDGEPFPSHFGTGSEDYYGYAFNSTDPFEAPFNAQPIAKGNWGIGHTTNVRSRIHDRIPFATRFQFDMELFHWQPRRKIDYATTTYWYAFGSATDNGQDSREKVREKIAQPWE